MALSILRGPAGAGKSQETKGTPLVIDLTALWAALRQFERDEDGKFPVRTSDDPVLGLAVYLKATAVRYASREGMDGVVTTSSSAPEAVERLREQGATGPVKTINPGIESARRRLAGPDGKVSPECEKALARWFSE